MKTNIQVEVDAQVFLHEGGVEIGAVRKVAHDHLVVYIEGAGDFVIKGPEVHSAHDGKLVLNAAKLEPHVLEAAKRAHEREE